MDLSATIHLLGDLLGEVLKEQEGAGFLEVEEQIRALAKAQRAGEAGAGRRLAEAARRLSPNEARVVATAFAVYFDLVNLAEEASRMARLRERERAAHPEPTSQSIGHAVAQLKRRGVTGATLRGILEQLRIELVLTAHPTEAKRRSVLSKVEELADLLRQLRGAELLPRERRKLRDALRAVITGLWLTSRARTARPTVADEVRTNLYFVDAALWEALPWAEAALGEALATHYPELAAPSGWLRLASWVGGDRDGNPNVTTEVTAEALRLHRGLAVERHRRALLGLSRQLSFTARRVPAPAQLHAWIEARRPFSEHAVYLERRYPDEPYRLTCALLAEQLEAASRDDMPARLLDDAPHAPRVTVGEIRTPVEWMAEALPERLAEHGLRPLLRQLAAFGLHAAALDLREDAAQLTVALAETLRALGRGHDLERQAPPARLATLVRLIEEPAPPLAKRPGVTARTADTWALFRLAARALSVYGTEVLGPFVVSMTHSAADVITVLLLERWAGCPPQGIVPLFETLDDLAAAPEVLAQLFELPPYRAHLASLGGMQTVMIGYSDSNKDGGYAAARWALYRAQEEIDAVGRRHGVPITFFHGRGGTVARGGGQTHRAVLAQPPGTVHGRLRVTEQGEIVAARFREADLACRHLEQLVSGVLLASCPDLSPEARVAPEWRQLMEVVAAASRTAYRALVVETPGFAGFWRAATPIEEIGRLRIGSRPAVRVGGELTIEAVRAIPWVFSWMQSRFNLPSWYGLGAGLAQAAGRPEAKAVLAAMYAGWPFFKNLLDDAELSLLKADLGVAARYVGLVEDAASAEAIFATIRREYERTRRAVLEISGHRDLLEGEPVIALSVERRNPYVDPLNELQVETLRRLRALGDSEGTEARELREIVVLTVNGIAAGLKGTG